MKDVTLNDIQQLTELIAAHGVYALTVLVSDACCGKVSGFSMHVRHNRTARHWRA